MTHEPLEITIKLYGDTVKHAPGKKSQFSLTIEPGACLQEILKQINIPASGQVVLVNGRRMDDTYSFRDGDTMVLFPALCGG